MIEKKLYLICPECHIEQAIRDKFDSNAYFITALGSVFDMSEFEYAEDVHNVITDEGITELVIVNDTHCTFLENTIEKDNNHNTRAEKELETLLKQHQSKFKTIPSSEHQTMLAKLNIYNQAKKLRDIAFLGNEIRDGLLQVSGLLYNREIGSFTRLKLIL